MLNDKGHWGDKCCCCPECEKLNEKYGDPCGAYWDFTLELCDYFAKKYPEIKLVNLAYGITRDVPKLPGDGKTPKNLVVEIAPLGASNFLRDYKDTPRVHKNIADWGKIIGGKYHECKLEGGEEYFTNLYLGQPYEVDANTYAYEQVKKIYGDSEDLRKVYEFWTPRQPVSDDLYHSIFAEIDEKINHK